MRRISITRSHGTAGAVLLAMIMGAASAQDTPADVEAACATVEHISDVVCACIAERSAKALSAEQRAFYIAALTGDDAATTRLGDAMEPQALLDIAAFIQNSPDECAG